MRINSKNKLIADSYGQDDNYKDVLSALSQLDDNPGIDYVKENCKYEWKRNSRHPLQNAAKFFQCLIQRKCA